MPTLLAGVFRDHDEAEALLHDLEGAGFRRVEVVLIARDRAGAPAAAERETADAAAGAGTGAAVGGMAGLVAGIAAMAIPGIGAVIAAGPIAAALAGAGLGAAAGGVIGALSTLGMSHEAAHSYAEAMREGGTVVAIRTSDDQADRAEGLLNRHGALAITRHNRGQEVPEAGSEGNPDSG